MHRGDLPFINTDMYFGKASQWFKYPFLATPLNTLVVLRLDVIQQIFLEHIPGSYDAHI